jgi:hypothetical protein
MADMPMAPDVMVALDRFIAEHRPGMSRDEALQIIVRDWLIGAGFLRAIRPSSLEDVLRDHRGSWRE